MTRKRLKLLAVLGAALASAPFALRAQQPDVDREMEEAKALYRDASFAEAIVKLERAVKELRVLQDREIRRLQLADAYLHLALSHFALEDRAAAKDAFKAMIRLNPERRLDPQVYGPPVIELFEAARVEVATERPAGAAPARTAASPPPTAKKGGSKAPLVLLGIGAVGAGVALAAGGGSAPAPSTCASGQFAVSNARFDTAQVDCTGRIAQAYDLNYLFDATNSSQVSVNITSVASRFALVGQTGAGDCISFDDGQLTFSPLAAPAGAQQTVTVFRGGRCGNLPPGVSGSCEWIGTLTIATSCGSFTLQTQNRHVMLFR